MQASITKYMSNPQQIIPKSTYSALNLHELKLLCKKNNLKGYSKMRKDEIVNLLNKNGTGLLNCFELKTTIKNTNVKKQPYKVLDYLVNSKQIVLLQRIKTKSSNVVVYHPTTRFVFNEEVVKKNQQKFNVIGYLTEDLNVLPITKDMISMCKEWKFDYTLPENISTIEIGREDKLEDYELDNILYKTGTYNYDEDEEEDYPNYDELY
jgi:Rho termination factor, N-terminal domain